MPTRRDNRLDRTKGTEERKRHMSDQRARLPGRPRPIRQPPEREKPTVLLADALKESALPTTNGRRRTILVRAGSLDRPQSSFWVTFLKVFPAKRVTSAVACPFFSSGTMPTARDPPFAFTAASAAVSRGTFAFAMAAF